MSVLNVAQRSETDSPVAHVVGMILYGNWAPANSKPESEIIIRKESPMRMDVSDCEVLSLDSGVITCPVTQGEVPVLFITVRIYGQPPVNLAIRNPHRLAEDLPNVIAQSSVLNGGSFVPEQPEREN